jgi:hypothetical protein
LNQRKINDPLRYLKKYQRRAARLKEPPVPFILKPVKESLIFCYRTAVPWYFKKSPQNHWLFHQRNTGSFPVIGLSKRVPENFAEYRETFVFRVGQRVSRIWSRR